MRYREIKPNAAVGRFVRCYWMLEDSAPASSVQRIVPDGRSELIFNLGQPYESRSDGAWKPQPQCFLFGQITGPLVLRPAGPARMIGIRFHPHTAGQILRIPMIEITDSSVPLDDISVRLFRELKELEEHRSPLEQFAALDRIMLALGNRATSDDRLVSAAVREMQRGSMGVGAVADRLGLSGRQFERRFRQAVGIPPKLFSRMQRFQRVFPAVESAGGGWADAALQCGYYDQAHLIRDFREFAGKPPVALLAEDSDLARHFMQCARLSHFSKTRAHVCRLKQPDRHAPCGLRCPRQGLQRAPRHRTTTDTVLV